MSYSSFSSLLVSTLGFNAKKKFKHLVHVLDGYNYLYRYFPTLTVPCTRIKDSVL